jgi:hypothetical protein
MILSRCAQGLNIRPTGNEVANDDGKVVACSRVNFDNKPANQQALLI